MSLREQIQNRFKEIYEVNPDRWVYKDEVCEFAKRLNYSYGNGERSARELASGIDRATGRPIPITLEREERKGANGQMLTYYRYKPPQRLTGVSQEAIRIFDALPDKV